MVKLRHGRKQDRNIYLQRGPEPSDDDEYLGVIFDPAKAAILIEIVNTSGELVSPMRRRNPGDTVAP